ncbi:MAG: hypothetical protein U0790_16305 [Isosphaeraceae bacterium]
MRSFRLDPECVTQFRENLPGLLVGGLMAVLIARFRPALLRDGTTAAVIVAAICLVDLALGRIHRRLRQAYPGAQFYGLVTTGFAILLGGFAVWMVFRRDLGLGFNLAWPGVSFVLILAFVLLNRKNPAVLR